MMNDKNVEMKVLGELHATEERVTVILKNGYRMEGMVLDYDDAVIMLFVKDKQKMVYKHMISTIVRDVQEG